MSNDTSRTGEQTEGTPRVIFFGRQCRLSAEPLLTLIERRVDVRAIVMPTRKFPSPAPIVRLGSRVPRPVLPMASSNHTRSLQGIAADSGIPMFEVSALHHVETIETLREFNVDLVVVSCFPYRLPANLLGIAPLGGLNLHPSALPRYRGPDPLFWVYRNGETQTAVTVHALDERFDAGDIVQQAPVSIPLGLPGDELEAICAELGSRLLSEATYATWTGTAERVPQDESRATYYSWPDEDDLLVCNKWRAAQVYHFVRGVIPLGYMPMLDTPWGRFSIRQAQAYDESETPGHPELHGDILRLPCNPGMVKLTVSRG